MQFGFSGDSCTAVGFANAWGDLTEYLRYMALRQTLSDELAAVEDRAAASSAFLAVVSSWQKCLAAKGYPTSTDPLVFAESYPREPAAESRRAAVADAECKQDVRLVPRWTEVLAAEAEYSSPGLSVVAQQILDLRGEVVERLTT